MGPGAACRGGRPHCLGPRVAAAVVGPAGGMGEGKTRVGTRTNTRQSRNKLHKNQKCSTKVAAEADQTKTQKIIQSPEKKVGLENKVGPKNKVGPAYYFEIREPSGSCESIRLVKLASKNTFSHHEGLSGYEMERKHTFVVPNVVRVPDIVNIHNTLQTLTNIGHRFDHQSGLDESS